MSRQVSDTFHAAVNAQETGEVFAVLLEIDHPDLAAPIRVCNDMVNITSNGEVFVAYPFQITFPTDNNDGPPKARLTLDNIDQILISTIRAISTAPTIRIMVVLTSDPDTVEIDLPGFEMKDVSFDISTISADISVESFLTEPIPGDRFLPSTFPGVF